MARYRVQIMDIFYFFSFVHSFLSTWFGHTTVLELSVTSIVRNQWISLTRKEQLNLWRWHFFSEQQANDHSEQQANDHHLPWMSRVSRLGVSGLPNSPASCKWPSLTGEESVVKAWYFRTVQLPCKLHMTHHLPGKSRLSRMLTITYRGRAGCQGLVSPGCPTLRQVENDHHLPGKSRLSRLGVSGLPNSPASCTSLARASSKSSSMVPSSGAISWLLEQ